MKFIILLISILFINSQEFYQDPSGDLLQAMQKKMESVENYTVDALIKVDVDFIKIEDRVAEVSYIKPDQFEIKAEGFTLLPKKGMEMEFLSIMKDGYTSIWIKEVIIGEHNTALIKVIPDNSEADIILAEMWINPKTKILHRMRTYSANSRAYTINLFYTDHPFDLPDKIEVNFLSNGNKLPMVIKGDLEALSKDMGNEPSKGKITIQYSNYRVNE